MSQAQAGGWLPFPSHREEETWGGRQAKPEASPREAVPHPTQQTTFVKVKGVRTTGPKHKIPAL